MHEFDYDFDELEDDDELAHDIGRTLHVGDIFEPSEPGVCRECGCTEENACPGGCIWATPAADLCSRCARE